MRTVVVGASSRLGRCIAVGLARGGADVALLELGARRIRVSTVAPGLVRTPTTDRMWSVPGLVRGYEENTALSRHATPEEIADAVAFLASDDTAFFPGTTLLVVGGAHHPSYADIGKIRAEAFADEMVLTR